MDVQGRWLTAKQLRNHTSDCCAQSKPCGIDGCHRTHNRLLHGGLVTRNDFADGRVNHGY